MVQVRPAGRAVADVVDAVRAQAGRRELLEVGGAHVEMGPAARAGAEEGGAPGPEGLAQLLPDLVAAGTDGRPEGGQQVLPGGAGGHERLHRPGGDPGRRPPPSRVGRGHRPAPRVHDQDGQAVGGLDPEEQPRARGHRGVRLGPLFPRGHGHRGAVHLLQQQQAAPSLEGPADAPPRLLAVLAAGEAKALLEAVDQVRNAVEGGSGDRAQHPPIVTRTRPDPLRGLHLPMAVEDEGVVASTVEVLEIDEVKRRLAQGEDSVFTEAERAYARSKSDPERRLAARLAAKRAACRLLGGDVTPADIEVVRDCAGPPGLRFSARARRRMESLGAARALVSLSHERRHAAAAVVLLRGTE